MHLWCHSVSTLNLNFLHFNSKNARSTNEDSRKINEVINKNHNTMFSSFIEHNLQKKKKKKHWQDTEQKVSEDERRVLWFLMMIWPRFYTFYHQFCAEMYEIPNPSLIFQTLWIYLNKISTLIFFFLVQVTCVQEMSAMTSKYTMTLYYC